MITPKFNTLLKELVRIEQELMTLGECEDISYEIPSKELAQELADRIAAVTHETASNIGFARYEIEKLLKQADLIQ